MEVESEVGASYGVEDRRGDPFGGRPRLGTREGPIELCIVDRVPVFADEEPVVVRDTDDEEFARDFAGIELWDEPTDNPQPVEFVTVGDGLDVQRLAVSTAVDHRDREPDFGAIACFADREPPDVHLAGRCARGTESRHYSNSDGGRY